MCAAAAAPAAAMAQDLLVPIQHRKYAQQLGLTKLALRTSGGAGQGLPRGGI